MYKLEIVPHIRDIDALINKVRDKQFRALDFPSPENLRTLSFKVTLWAHQLDESTDISNEIVLQNFDALFTVLEFEIKQVADSQSINWDAPTRKNSLKEQIECFNAEINDLFPKIKDKAKTEVTNDKPAKKSRLKRIKFDENNEGFVEKKKLPKRKKVIARSIANEEAEATNEIDQNLVHSATSIETKLKPKFDKSTRLEEALVLQSSLKEFDDDILTSPKILTDLSIREEIKRFNKLIKDADKILDEWKKFDSNCASNTPNNEQLDVLANFNEKINQLHKEIKEAKLEIILLAQNLLHADPDKIKAEHANAIEHFNANLEIFFEKLEKLDLDNKVVKNIAENFIRDFTEKLSKEPSFNQEQVKALRHSLLSKIGIVEKESALSNMSSLLSFGRKTSFNLSNLVRNFPTDDTEALSRHVKSLYDLAEYLEDFELSVSKDSDLVSQDSRIEKEISNFMDNLNRSLQKLTLISKSLSSQLNDSNYLAVIELVNKRREPLIQIQRELEDVKQSYERELASKENTVTPISDLKETVPLQKEVLEKLRALRVKRNDLNKTASFESIKTAYFAVKNEMVEGYKIAIDNLLNETLTAAEKEKYDSSSLEVLIMHGVAEKVKELLALNTFKALPDLPSLEAQLREDLSERTTKVLNKRYLLQAQSIESQYLDVNQYASQLKELTTQVGQFPTSLRNEAVEEARLLVKILSKINFSIQDGYRSYQEHKQQQINIKDKVLIQNIILNNFKPELEKLAKIANVSNTLDELTKKLKALNSELVAKYTEERDALKSKLPSSPVIGAPTDSSQGPATPKSLSAEVASLKEQQFEENNKKIADKYSEISKALNSSIKDLEDTLPLFPYASKEPSVCAGSSHLNSLKLARRELESISKSISEIPANKDIVTQQPEILSQQNKILTDLEAINKKQDSKHHLNLTALLERETKEKEILVAQFEAEVSKVNSLLPLYEGEKKARFLSSLEKHQREVTRLKGAIMHIGHFKKEISTPISGIELLFKQIKEAIKDSKDAELKEIQQKILEAQKAQEEACADLDRLEDRHFQASLAEITRQPTEIKAAISQFAQKSSVVGLTAKLIEINSKINTANTALENEKTVREKFLSKEHKACVEILKVIKAEYAQILTKSYNSSGKTKAMMESYLESCRQNNVSGHMKEIGVKHNPDPVLDKERREIDPRLSKLAMIYNDFSAINDSYFADHSENATQTYRTALSSKIQSLQHNEMYDISANMRPWYARLVRAITRVFRSNVNAPAPDNNGAHVSSNRYSFSPTLGACKTEERLVNEFNHANKMLNDEEIPPASAATV